MSVAIYNKMLQQQLIVKTTYAQQIFKQIKFYILFKNLPDDLIRIIGEFVNLNFLNMAALLKVRIRSFLIHIKPDIYLPDKIVKLYNSDVVNYLLANYRGHPFRLKPVGSKSEYINSKQISEQNTYNYDVSINFKNKNKKMSKKEYQQNKNGKIKKSKFNNIQVRKHISKLEHRLMNRCQLKKDLDRLPWYDSEWDYFPGIMQIYDYYDDDYDDYYDCDSDWSYSSRSDQYRSRSSSRRKDKELKDNSEAWCYKAVYNKISKCSQICLSITGRGIFRKKNYKRYQTQFNEFSILLSYNLTNNNLLNCYIGDNNPLKQYKDFYDFFVRTNKDTGQTRQFRKFLSFPYNPNYIEKYLENLVTTKEFF
jgi:hypothetical protein